MPNMNMNTLKSELQIDEGYSALPYRDTRGKITIGIGRNLTDNGLRDSEIMTLLDNDIIATMNTLDREIKWWRTKPDPVQRVLVNLCFNLGWPKFSQFETFLNLINDDRFDEAAEDLETTAWYGQVQSRGPRMVARLKQAQGTSGVAS